VLLFIARITARNAFFPGRLTMDFEASTADTLESAPRLPGLLLGLLVLLPHGRCGAPG